MLAQPAKLGRRCLLTVFEEEKLVEWIEFRCLRALAPTPLEIRAKACDILECRGITTHVGEGWLQGFYARNASLNERCARTKEQARAGLQQEQIARFFFKLEKAELEDPACVVNFSCSNLCVD